MYQLCPRLRAIRWGRSGRAGPLFFWPRPSPLFSSPRVRGFPFLNSVFSSPPRPFRLYVRFPLFCPGPRPRSFLLFGPVMLVAVSFFACAYLGARRPSSAVLRVSCEVYQGSAPAEHLRPVLLAQTDAPHFGAAGLLSLRGRRQDVLAITATRVNEKAGGRKKKR